MSIVSPVSGVEWKLPKKTSKAYRIAGKKGKGVLVQKEFAALQFLQSIPMKNQPLIEQGNFTHNIAFVRRRDDHRITINDDSDSDEERELNDTPEHQLVDGCSLADCVTPLYGCLTRPSACLSRCFNPPQHIPKQDEPNEMEVELQTFMDEPTSAAPLDDPMQVKSPPVGGERDVRGGRRLDGGSAAVIHIPTALRHKLNRGGVAPLRQWEHSTVNMPGLDHGRMFFSSQMSYPLIVSSVIRYNPTEEIERQRRLKLMDESLLEAFAVPKRDWRGTSYAKLLQRPGAEEVDPNEESESEEEYEPGELDDPEMVQGKFCQVIRGNDKVGPVMLSILHYAKPKDIKDDLNKQFREQHPTLPQSLSLSKIRNIKSQSLEGCLLIDIEVSTVAYACIYFERLCLKKLVNKSNRRLAMAGCLVIAYKFNEPQIGEDLKLINLIDFIDEEWSISASQVRQAEFGILVALSFSLHSPSDHVFHHFSRLLKSSFVNKSPREYLGDFMHELFSKERDLDNTEFNIVPFSEIGSDIGYSERERSESKPTAGASSWLWRTRSTGNKSNDQAQNKPTKRGSKSNQQEDKPSPEANDPKPSPGVSEGSTTPNKISVSIV